MCIRSKKEEQATFAMCCVCNRESPLGGSIKKKKSGGNGKDSTAESGKAKPRRKDI